MNLKHSQMMYTHGVVAPQEFWTFGPNMQVVNMVQIKVFNIPLETYWNLNNDNGLALFIWSYELELIYGQKNGW
jgi:hypothetical protein